VGCLLQNIVIPSIDAALTSSTTPLCKPGGTQCGVCAFQVATVRQFGLLQPLGGVFFLGFTSNPVRLNNDGMCKAVIAILLISWQACSAQNFPGGQFSVTVVDQWVK
jgi:hypothetical protein